MNERCAATKVSFWMLLNRRIARAIRKLSSATKWRLTYVYPNRAGLGSHVRGTKEDGPIDHAQQYGVASIPPPHDNMVVISVAIGRSAEHHVIVGEIDHTGARPLDLSIGDVCLYTGGGQRAWLKIDGTILLQGPSGASIEIAPDGAISINGNGQPININNPAGQVNLGATGGASVAREGDAVAPTAQMLAWMTAVTAAADPDGSLGVAAALPTTQIGTISEGSGIVKAAS